MRVDTAPEGEDILRIQVQKVVSDSIMKTSSSSGGGIASLISAVAGLFGGGGFGTGSSYGNQDYGAYLATGTNYMPYDGFKATLHKGEAVVPAKYNEAAGGRSRGGDVFIENHGAQVQAERQDNGDLRVVVEAAAAAGYQRMVGDLASGTGRGSEALRIRHGVGPGNLAKRK